MSKTSDHLPCKTQGCYIQMERTATIKYDKVLGNELEMNFFKFLERLFLHISYLFLK